MINLTKRFAVYVDVTYEGKPFYVGKGSQVRVNNSKRNYVHQRITSKYGMMRVVVFESDDEFETLNEEIRLIEFHKTFINGGEDFWGANLTRGGEGTSGAILTEKTRRKQSLAQIAIRHKMSKLMKELTNSRPDYSIRLTEINKKRWTDFRKENWVTINCQNCKNSFEERPSRKNRKFCGQKCHYENARRKTSEFPRD